MRKKIKNSKIAKLSLAFAALLLFLSSIGLGYSAWTDTIYVTGTITTGEWDSDETAWGRMYDVPDDFTYEFPGANWATHIIHRPTANQVTFYLYAAQHYRVGKLHIWKNTDNLFVEYDLDPGFTMSESHLHIAISLTGLTGIPQSNGNPVPGQFAYKQDHDPYVSEYLYTIPWDQNWCNIDLYIAAHAVVWGFFT